MKNIILKQTETEIWVAPCADPPKPKLSDLTEEKPVIYPHQNEKIDADNLGKFQKMKSFLKNKLSANNL